MEALIEMQEQKVVRYLGVTGHYRPDALMEAINRHPFDYDFDGDECGRFAYSQFYRCSCCRWRWRSRWALSG